MRIKYCGNYIDDNGHVRDNTRIAVIIHSDKEIDIFSRVCSVLFGYGYKYVDTYYCNDCLNETWETWFAVKNKEDFDNFKEIYLDVKRNKKSEKLPFLIF